MKTTITTKSSFKHCQTRSLLLSALLVLWSSPVAAGGGARPQPVINQDPVDSQAYPVRLLSFGEFTTAPFRTSDGRDVGIGNDVRLLVDTRINQSDKFRTIVPGTPHSAQPHGIITGGISAIVFEVASLGIKFGYRLDSSGAAQPINEGSGTRLTGELTVKIGVLAMDFKIYNPLDGRVYAAASVDQSMVGLNLEFKVNFDALEIGPEFIWNTPLKDIIQNAAATAMVRLAQSRDINLLPWSAKVLAVDAKQKLVLFEAGVADAIVAGNNFEAYSACHHEDCFQLYLADLKVKRVLQYTEAVVKNDPNGDYLRTIQPGDKVFIRYLRPR